MRKSICLLVLGLVALGGCSSESIEKAEVAAEKQIEYEDCKEAFEPLLDSLNDVNSDLTVGVNVGDYGSTVREANRAYSEVMTSGDIGGVNCLERVGVPAERAINYHVKAFNAWNKCVSDLDCDDSSVEDRRQRLWLRASNSTTKAEENLAKLEPDSVE